MACTNGRWEGEIVVPVGGWDSTLNEADGGGNVTVNIALGTYTWATLLVEFKSGVAGLDAMSANGHVYTVTISQGEGGTGILTITSNDEQGFTLTAVDAAFFALIGSSGAMTPADQNQSGDQHVQAMWLPDGPWSSSTGLGDDIDEDNTTVTENTSGNVNKLVYQRKQSQTDLTYQAVTRARCRIAGESIVGESFQQFWRDVIQGDLDYVTLTKVRIFPDAGDANTHQDYYVSTWEDNFRPVPVTERWTGLWDIRIPRLVVVP